MAADRPQPPEAVIDRLRAICDGLPGAREHDAWTGTSWRVRDTTFAHVVEIADGWPPAYVTAFGTDGPATVVTFQASPDDAAALRAVGDPYHHPPWRPGIVGAVIDDTTDWAELAELVVDSYRECGGQPS
jgi:hypothetical protein